MCHKTPGFYKLISQDLGIIRLTSKGSVPNFLIQQFLVGLAEDMGGSSTSCQTAEESVPNVLTQRHLVDSAEGYNMKAKRKLGISSLNAFCRFVFTNLPHLTLLWYILFENIRNSMARQPTEGQGLHQEYSIYIDASKSLDVYNAIRRIDPMF